MTTLAQDQAHDRQLPQSALLPGVALSAVLAAMAFALRALPGIGVFSPMILSILLGMAFHNLLGTPTRARPGVQFALRRVLRFAIILLGLQLTAQQVVAVGGTGVAIIAATLVTTFLVTKLLGRLLGVDRKLTELIAAGTSICGASAVVAVNTVTRAKDEDVAYAVACVTIFGSIA
ncbi:MAG TPA: putative sulfate exporter family transporter, partial [Rhizomicrobium sp.]|nr:putative sulfate exporter family transporter [Rhizomicrobium sp.]